ncbi:MAG: hypothetical protein WA958_20135 [Tunicatimonas sp.]
MKTQVLDLQFPQNNLAGNDTEGPAQTTQSDLLLSQIDLVIHRVANNQLSAGQGWREVKRIMHSRNDSQDEIM